MKIPKAENITRQFYNTTTGSRRIAWAKLYSEVSCAYDTPIYDANFLQQSHPPPSLKKH